MMKRKVISVVLVLVCIFLLPVSVVANAVDDITIQPYFLYTDYTTTSFYISSTGYATGTVSYYADAETFSRAVINSKIQKNVNGTWVDVSGASWRDYCYNFRLSTTPHSKQLTERGNYRFCVTYLIYGDKGVPDEIPTTRWATY